MKTIGDRIRELRDLRNMTQQQLADGMGESSGRVIYNWEKGISRPDSDKIVRLCAVLQDFVPFRHGGLGGIALATKQLVR